MTDEIRNTKTNVGAGLAKILRYDPVSKKLQDLGAMYDPLPEIPYEREALDDTHSKTEFERTKAGIKKSGSMEIKLKTGSAGLALIKQDYEAGTESLYCYRIPVAGNSESDTEDVYMWMWVSAFKKAPSMKDETFVMVTFNINEIDPDIEGINIDGEEDSGEPVDPGAGG